MKPDHIYDEETAVSTSTQAAEGTDRDSSDSAAAPVGIGPILEKAPEKAVKLINSYFDDTEDKIGEFVARWKANRKRRQGVIGVHVVKPDPDRSEWKVWAPPGAARVPPTFNQPARLCRRLVSNLHVDKPLPEVTPGTASDSSKPDAAEYQTRILQDVCTSKFYNVPEIAEKATDKACTYDSSFVRVWVDPQGGGSKPRAIMASMKATTVRDALYVDGDDSTPQESPYVTRYVKPLAEGVTEPDLAELTDDPALAELQWLPGIRHEHLTGLNLRPIPWTATSLEECQGIVIRTPAKLGDLRKQYPEQIEGLSVEELWDLAGQRPLKNQEGQPAQAVQKQKDSEEPPPDETLITVTMVYMGGEGGSYPNGAYAVAAGSKYLLHRQKWEVKVNGVAETLPIPIAHFAGWEEGEDSFYKFGLMHFLGPGQEVRAAALGGAIEHLDRFNRRKVFYTPQGLFQPKMGPAAMGVMVPIQQGTKPEVEEFPEYPQIGMEILNLATAELNDESGLSPISQGQTDPSVQSGLHAQKIIEQTNIGLGGIKRNTEKGIIRLWEIANAYLRGYFTEPQKIRFRGDDQQYKEKSWSAADLTDSRDVRILDGSFTMLAPSAKLSVAEYMRKLNLIDDNQLRMMASGNIGGLMGLQDDPALLRIRRQISLWEEGPPKAEDPAESMPDQYPGETASQEPASLGMGGAGQPEAEGPAEDAQEPGEEAPAPAMAPVSDPSVIGSIMPAPGMPPIAAPDPMQVAGAQLFKRVSSDLEPAVAQIRFRELSRTQQSTKYERQPEPWKAIFEAEYQAMRSAAGVGTAAEAQQGQAAAAQAKTAEADKERQVKMSIATAGDQTAVQIEQMKEGHELQASQLEMEHSSVLTQAELEAKKRDQGAGEDPAIELQKKGMEINAENARHAQTTAVEARAKGAKLLQEGSIAQQRVDLERQTQEKRLEIERKKANKPAPAAAGKR